MRPWLATVVPGCGPVAVSRGPLTMMCAVLSLSTCVLMLMNHTGDSAVDPSDSLRGSYLGYPETQSGTWEHQTFTPFSDPSAGTATGLCPTRQVFWRRVFCISC